MVSLRLLAVTIAAAGLLGASEAAAVSAKGAGATFPQPVYGRWAALYGAETGDAVTYVGTGSGAGVKAVENATVAFGASDVPLDEPALQSQALVQFPTLVGGVVPVIDLPGIGPGDLVLDGSTLADLFMGRIGFWDDGAIAAINPHLTLPHLAVTPVRRSDASGTTAVFAAYLAHVSNQDLTWLGQNSPVLRPIGIAAEGSAGVADAVAATPGAVGYVGFDFAQERRLAYVDLVNPAGRVVQPTLASIAAAAQAADWSGTMTPSLLLRPDAASWPIVSATYVLMRRTNQDDLAAWTALKFFGWAFRSGGPAAEDLGFVPIPARVEAEVRGVLLGVRNLKGLSLAPPDVTRPPPGASP